jgi:hypothetical protein
MGRPAAGAIAGSDQAEAPQQDRLLRVDSIFRFVEHHRTVALEDIRSYFLADVRR